MSPFQVMFTVAACRSEAARRAGTPGIEAGEVQETKAQPGTGWISQMRMQSKLTGSGKLRG